MKSVIGTGNKFNYEKCRRLEPKSSRKKTDFGACELEDNAFYNQHNLFTPHH